MTTAHIQSNLRRKYNNSNQALASLLSDRSFSRLLLRYQLIFKKKLCTFKGRNGEETPSFDPAVVSDGDRAHFGGMSSILTTVCVDPFALLVLHIAFFRVSLCSSKVNRASRAGNSPRTSPGMQRRNSMTSK